MNYDHTRCTLVRGDNVKETSRMRGGISRRRIDHFLNDTYDSIFCYTISLVRLGFLVAVAVIVVVGLLSTVQEEISLKLITT